MPIRQSASGPRTPRRMDVALSVLLVVAGVVLPLILDSGATEMPPSVVTADVAVYGATASGVIAAVSAAETGASVVLLEPGSDVGGMVASGLGHTDVVRKDLVGGLTLDFYVRVQRHYELSGPLQKVSWNHEPHAAARIFRTMLDEAGVRVLLHQPLDRTGGVSMAGGRITEIRTAAGTAVRAAVFVDSSYEGDLLAAAGVSYAVGREAQSAYSEALAGVRPVSAGRATVPGRSAVTGAVLRGISTDPLEAAGSADHRIQPYTFRLCVTDVEANRVPFAPPPGYDGEAFAVVGEAIRTAAESLGKAPPIESFLTISPLPNRKADLNNFGLFSTDYVGGSYAWPEADDATRDRLWTEHRDYVAGVLFFMANDGVVPAAFRHEVARWGLCADEFMDTGHWPPQVYVREARRMIGRTVLTQRDIQTDVHKPDSIGLGAYRVDSHIVRRVLDGNGFVRGEGQLNAPVEPYQISLGILLPKRNEVENLVVSVAVSTSHVGWTSVRMEPQLMTMGEAAGVVAALAAERSGGVENVLYPDVARVLKERGAILEVP